MLAAIVSRLLHCAIPGMMALAASITAPIHAAAEEIALRSRYAVGDRYALSLTVDTNTHVDARGGARDSFREKVELRYAAQVEVLETDDTGLPRRERHEGVELTSIRPEGTRELFVKGAAFDLTRRVDGGVEIESDGERIAPQVEKIVGDLLAHRIEYGIAELLDPGHPVAIAERWELDAARAREFLRARGIDTSSLDGPAEAVLEGGSEGPVLRYRIPIREFAVEGLPKGASRSDSGGRLEGEVQLDESGMHRARSHRSKLELDIRGLLSAAPQRAPAGSWHLRRSQSVDQRSETLVATRPAPSG